MSQGMKLLSFTAPNKEPVEKKDDIIGKKISKKIYAIYLISSNDLLVLDDPLPEFSS